MKSILITGSAGLIGAEAVRYYNKIGYKVVGIDNNMRARFFGPDGDTSWQRAKLQDECQSYTHVDVDIRDRNKIMSLFADLKPDAIIHCAAQPSHDLAARIPFDDFEVNACGTLNLLEATRQSVPEAPFVFMSTNKVYGDAPNELALVELATRWDYEDPAFANGISESFSIDQSKHSLFGASKVAADVMVQEYGRYFSMKTVCFRGGCLTGAGHSGAQLHGYLAYLFKAAAEKRHYTIFGYKGKQVRDQIHSRDVVAAFDAFIRNPRSGAVYNLGGGKSNSVSVLESIDRVGQLLGHSMSWSLSAENRIGDHICYYTDLTRFQRDYPEWSLSTTIDDIFEEFASAHFSSRREIAESLLPA
ncbi:NAD-dependent epimerase/dehydratase family protein [Microvirga solisilvae]|uniref:NAD-dependent epimerase/dehydratase family protein n=1 Tax=Microvirga solisilvae TaxID=2919498 RepID=UPI001FAF1093|nr:NAD-dependent epimerase/dehydratase family protein [Microvirga solisilvae]